MALGPGRRERRRLLGLALLVSAASRSLDERRETFWELVALLAELDPLEAARQLEAARVFLGLERPPS